MTFEEKHFIILGEIERDLVSQIESDLIWMHICSYWEMQFCKRYHVLIAIWINLICYRCFIEHSDRAKIQTFDLHFFQDWLSIFCVHSLHINAPFLILLPISGHTIVLFKSDGWEECINLCQSEEKLDFAKNCCYAVAACAKFHIRKSGVFGNIWWLGKLLAAIISATGIARFISPHTRPTTVYTPTLQGYTPGHHHIHCILPSYTKYYQYSVPRIPNSPLCKPILCKV